LVIQRLAKNIGFGLAGCLLLAACGMTSQKAGPVMLDAPANAIPLPPVSPYKLNSMTSMAEYMSNGDVHIYSLDADAPLPPPLTSMQAGDITTRSMVVDGVQSGQDSNVMLFPLDGPSPGTVRPQMMPMATPYGDFPSPFAQGAILEKIYFRHGSTHLSGKDKAEIARLSSVASAILLVEGHASTRTATQDPEMRHVINMDISRKRAEKVAQELVRKGVPAQNIKTAAWGDTRPGVIVAGMDAETASRRVEIIKAQ